MDAVRLADEVALPVELNPDWVWIRGSGRPGRDQEDERNEERARSEKATRSIESADRYLLGHDVEEYVAVQELGSTTVLLISAWKTLNVLISSGQGSSYE